MDLFQSRLFTDHSSKEPMHLYGANGFPLGVYQPLLELLAQDYNVGALANRATWRPAVSLHKSRSWQIYADDLITFLEQQACGPVIGVGHSLGATTTVLAAKKRPDLFSKLVLIEPAMLAKPLAAMVQVLPKVIMTKINPVKGTLNKRERFTDRDDFLTHIKKFKGYAKFSEQMFELFADHSIIKNEQGDYQLAFPKHWEAHNYSQPPNIMRDITKLEIPVVAIRGKPSMFFSHDMWRHWQQACPHSTFLESMAHGHLLPLEAPNLCGELIRTGLTE